MMACFCGGGVVSKGSGLSMNLSLQLRLNAGDTFRQLMFTPQPFVVGHRLKQGCVRRGTTRLSTRRAAHDLGLTTGEEVL